MPVHSLRSRPWRIVLTIGAVVFLDGGAPARAEPGADEGIEQIERRIRRQREENLRSVRGLVERLSARCDELRSRLAKDEMGLSAVGGAGGIPERDQEIDELEDHLERRIRGMPPMPSPDAPHPIRIRGVPSVPVLPEVNRAVPPLPADRNPLDLDSAPPRTGDRRPLDLGPAPPRTDGRSPLDLDPGEGPNPIEIKSRLRRVREGRAALRKALKDLIRARILLEELGDDEAPPPPVIARPSNPRRPGEPGKAASTPAPTSTRDDSKARSPHRPESTAGTPLPTGADGSTVSPQVARPH